MKKLLYAECTYGKPEIKAVNKVLKNGWLSGGEQTAKFEEELAKWYGVKYAISTNSGSTANFIALQSLDLPKGSEVITTACGFPTTVSPIYYHGLVPVYVGIQSYGTYTIDLEEVEQVISKKTKAIMFAHTLGNMCDMDKLMGIVKKHNLRLIEDTCDAVGSKWNGKLAGTFGDLATLSFYPAHHMTTGGEGGAIITNSSQLYKKCKSIRDWGRACYCKWDETNPDGACRHRFDNFPFDHRYFYTSLGLNMKMTEMQAAFGREQLKRLDRFIEKRKKNFKRLYDNLNRDIRMRMLLPRWGVKYQKTLVWKKPGDFSKPKKYGISESKKKERAFNNPIADISWFAFPLTFDLLNRTKIMEYLESKGIQTRTLFAGDITQHPAYKNLPYRAVESLLNTKTVMESTLFVGVGPKLTFKDMDYMAKTIKEVL